MIAVPASAGPPRLSQARPPRSPVGRGGLCRLRVHYCSVYRQRRQQGWIAGLPRSPMDMPLSFRGGRGRIVFAFAERRGSASTATPAQTFVPPTEGRAWMPGDREPAPDAGQEMIAIGPARSGSPVPERRATRVGARRYPRPRLKRRLFQPAKLSRGTQCSAFAHTGAILAATVLYIDRCPASSRITTLERDLGLCLVWFSRL